MRGNCSFPPGNRSSDAGNERFNDRKINFDAWCAIFLLTAVLQILYLQRICNGICNAIIVYQSVYYFDFVAGGRCFFIYNSNKSSLNIPDLLRSLCYIKYVTQNM